MPPCKGDSSLPADTCACVRACVCVSTQINGFYADLDGDRVIPPCFRHSHEVPFKHGNIETAVAVI
eukprot:1143590-Pelagomonas_calceolata.AAC.3